MTHSLISMTRSTNSTILIYFIIAKHDSNLSGPPVAMTRRLEDLDMSLC